ncbi:MAG: hypothetical protein SNJ56_03715, partial [Termitinemataceae bacterium]
EAGRGGRDGEPSLALLLWGIEDRDQFLYPYVQSVSRCRRQQLFDLLTGNTLLAERLGEGSAYSKLQGNTNRANCAFDQTDAHLNQIDNIPKQTDSHLHPVSCAPGPTACDVCKHDTSQTVREMPAILSFFRHQPRRYTLREAIDLLTEHSQFRWSENEAHQAVINLIRSGILGYSKNPVWKHRLVATGKTAP